MQYWLCRLAHSSTCIYNTKTKLQQHTLYGEVYYNALLHVGHKPFSFPICLTRRCLWCTVPLFCSFLTINICVSSDNSWRHTVLLKDIMISSNQLQVSMVTNKSTVHGSFRQVLGEKWSSEPFVNRVRTLFQVKNLRTFQKDFPGPFLEISRSFLETYFLETSRKWKLENTCNPDMHCAIVAERTCARATREAMGMKTKAFSHILWALRMLCFAYLSICLHWLSFTLKP